MANLLKTLQNNWKKTIFFGIVGYMGTDKLTERIRTENIMRKLSIEAESYGTGPLPPGARPKHITVILNPAAGDRKGRDKFEKYAEPLIHLSGFLVNVVKTEQISEARQLVGLVEKTNIIAVGGGDGTLMEVVTGLLRRDDAEEAVRRFPIGVIPVGRQNSFAAETLDYDPRLPKKSIAQAAMGVSRHHIQPKDVIMVELMTPPTTHQQQQSTEELELGLQTTHVSFQRSESEENYSRPYYIMSGFKLGDFCEAKRRESELPSLLPSGFRQFWSLLRTQSVKSKLEVRYRSYCAGCSNCKNLWVKSEEETSFLGRMRSVFKPSVYALDDIKWSTPNCRCGVWNTICVEANELNVVPQGDGKLEIQVGKNFSKPKFIGEGFRRRYTGPATFSRRIVCQEVEIIPVSVPYPFYLDNEDFPTKPIRMQVLRNKVNFFQLRRS